MTPFGEEGRIVVGVQWTTLVLDDDEDCGEIIVVCRRFC